MPQAVPMAGEGEAGRAEVQRAGPPRFCPGSSSSEGRSREEGESLSWVAVILV